MTEQEKEKNKSQVKRGVAQIIENISAREGAGRSMSLVYLARAVVFGAFILAAGTALVFFAFSYAWVAATLKSMGAVADAFTGQVKPRNSQPRNRR